MCVDSKTHIWKILYGYCSVLVRSSTVMSQYVLLFGKAVTLFLHSFSCQISVDRLPISDSFDIIQTCKNSIFINGALLIPIFCWPAYTRNGMGRRITVLKAVAGYVRGAFTGVLDKFSS